MTPMHIICILWVGLIFQVLPASSKALQTYAKKFHFNLVGTRCLVADAHRPSYFTYAFAHTKVILVALLLKDICSQSLTISA